jgi:fumarate hydratase subunit beta
MQKLKLPLDQNNIDAMHYGDELLLYGVIYVARDAAHKRLIDALEKGMSLPFDIKGQTIYYMGPSPARPGNTIGSAGPTTSGRMDIYTPRLLEEGLKGMIGKGQRSAEVKQAICKYKAVYLGTIGGIGALIADTIKKSEIVAFPDLGAEAVRKLEIEEFPVTVINDIYGGDLYESGRARYCTLNTCTK